MILSGISKIFKYFSAAIDVDLIKIDMFKKKTSDHRIIAFFIGTSLMVPDDKHLHSRPNSDRDHNRRLLYAPLRK